MRIEIANFKQTPLNFMRSCGYAFDKQEGNETAFTKRLSNQDYPRFHAYVRQEDNKLVINLHIDQKRPSYQGHTAHSGDYDSDLISTEGNRIKSLHR